jgi:predicted AAA+ superfamily ATPase
MIARAVQADIEDALKSRVAVLLDGLPRVGRSSLAAIWTEGADTYAVTFDADNGGDRQCLGIPSDFIDLVDGHLVIIENIDEHSLGAIANIVRLAGDARGSTRFVLVARLPSIGRQLAQRLAGHIRVFEIPPLQPDEAFRNLEMNAAPEEINLNIQVEASPIAEQVWDLETHWLRGGFPESLDAADDAASFQWRADYLAALLNGDFSDWDIVAGDRTLDVVRRIADAHSQIFDEDKCRNELGLDRNSVRRSLDMLVRIGLIRRLPNWVKGHPVLYIRDAGLFHALQGLQNLEQLRADQALGHSWEAFSAEALVIGSAGRAEAYYYRDKDQNEVDLILDFRPAYDAVCAIEFKVDSKEKVEAGFWRACEAIKATHRFVVHTGSEIEDKGNGLLSMPLMSAIERVRAVFK